MAWEQATSLDQLRDGPVVFRSGPRQLALFLAGEETYAIDNRCPHEGYPLAQGTLDEGCMLTCNWHNWKFNLDHGLRDPIFSAHVLKTTVAVEEELLAAGESRVPSLLPSLNRFLNSPLKQKHVRRLARQANELVGRDFKGD